MEPGASPIELKATPASRATSRKLPLAVVQPKRVRRVVIGNVKIRVPVPIAVERGDGHRPVAGGVQARLAGHILEGAIPAVAIKHVGFARIRQRTGIRPGVLFRNRAGIEREIIGDKQVEVPVAVGVKKRGRDARLRVAHTRSIGDLLERAVPTVTEQLVLPDVHDVKVGMTVVVVVADRDGAGKTGATKSGLGGHIFEGAVAAVAIKPVGLAFGTEAGGGHPFERTPVDEVNVHPTVAIVVEDGAARPVREHDVGDAPMAKLVHKIDPGAERDIFKDVPGTGGDRGARLTRRFSGLGKVDQAQPGDGHADRREENRGGSLRPESIGERTHYFRANHGRED